MKDDLLIQRPAPATPPATELLLLFHGVGSSAENLRPLGQALAAQRPGAWVVNVRSPHPSESGAGWQWFSVQGVTEANRRQRVAAAMPAFLDKVSAWQRQSGVAPQRTTLIGFSQGAIMALESTQQSGAQPVSGRVIAIAGRLARPPIYAPANTVVNLMHGDQDPVMPIGLAIEADSQLRALGVPSTLDRFPGLGHVIDTKVVDAIVGRLNQAQEWP